LYQVCQADYSDFAHFLLHCFLRSGKCSWSILLKLVRLFATLQEGEDVMPLDPRIQAFLEQAGLLMKPGSIPREPEVLLSDLRASAKKAIMALGSEAEPVTHVDDRVIPGPLGDIPVRLYTPEGNGPFPILVYFHGGGWVAGSLDACDMACRYLCREAGCLVLSVGYRLPPEHKFPAGLEDCYAATCWIAAHAAEVQGDSSRIAVGGDSGGGNFAAALALMCRDRSGPALTFQLLLVPVMDFGVTTSSWKEYDGYMMIKEEFLIAANLYLSGEAEQLYPYAAPLLAPGLHGLPPALIITAECDPVRDSGELYGQRLSVEGVPTTVSRYDGMVHGFMGMRSLAPQANQAWAEVVHSLRTVFSSAEFA
jgi:acetyl esterase